MRKIFVALLALFASAGIANAAGPGNSTDLRSAMGGQMQPFVVTAPAGVCDPGTPSLVIHDDGQGENGYGWNPSAGTDGRYADKFTPVAYPATIKTVCMPFITNAGVTSFNFKVAVYAADGAGGAPGTLLGSKAFVGHPAAIAGLPFTPTFEAFDISDLSLVIPSGSVYISANWDATTGTSGVFLGTDESPATPMAGGYNYSGTGPWAALGGTNQPNYRALMIRAVMPPSGPGAPSVSKAFAPAQVLAGVKSTLTITLGNGSQPTAAVLSAALTDTFPAGLVVASPPNAATTCTGGTVTAAAGGGSVALNSGASIPASGTCTVKVDVSSAADGTYVNTIAAGALQTQHGNNAGAATATLKVGLTFPEPYCGITFPSNVEPITRVRFANIDKTSGAALNGTPALEDFTAVIGNVNPGTTYSMAVEGNTDGNFTTKIKVYVDWNQNGVFTDPGESYVIGDLANSTGTDGKQAVADMLVPAGALNGTTRMRVTKRFSAAAEPCNSTGFGQAEDYTLTVGPTTGPDLVCPAALNHAIVNNIDGTSVNWSTGVIVDAGPSTGYDFNPYGSGNKLAFFWQQSTVGAGVADSATGTDWKVLQPGAEIGPSSVFSRGTGAATNWDGGVDGYLGFKFNCSSIPNAPASGLCYGYAHMTSTGPNGFPATLVDYCYNKAGNAITIPTPAAPPTIGVTPANLSASVAAGATTTKTLAIGNTGGSNLDWTISEALPAATGGNPARQSAHRDASQHVPFVRDYAQFPLANVIADGGFEQGDPNPVWDVFSSTFGSPLCTVAACGTGTGTGPHGGTWWAWFGGINAAETGYARQTVTIPSGTATLSFWLEVRVTSGLAADFLKVSIDGTEVWRVTGATASAYSNYQKVTVDVSAFAGGAHLLSFDSTVVGGGANGTNFFVDDVALDAGSGGGGGCSAPSDLPWASVNPVSGTTAAGASSNVTVTFNAAGLAAGAYNGLLCVGSNDPVNPLVSVPVSLTVGGTGEQNGIITAGPFNHAIQQTVAGTSLNIVSSAFDDAGPISGNWDFNFWASSGNLTLWRIGPPNDGQYVVDGSGKALLMHPGDTVGAGNTFTTGTGTVAFSAAWLAGTDGYLGVKFNCNGRLANPVAGVCYGYVHIKTTAGNGFPATILDTAFDGDNNTITIIDDTGGPPIAEVTPAAGFDFTVDEGSTGTDTMVVKNIGGGTLTYSIAESEVAKLNPPSYKTAAAQASKGNVSGVDLSAELVGARMLGLNGSGEPLMLTAAMISQMADNTPGDQGVSCGQSGVSTSDNSWWRRFYFSEHAAVGASANITGVTVSSGSTAIPGGLPITINLYTIAHSTAMDTIPTSGLTLIGTKSGVISGGLASVTIPVTGTVGDTVGKDLVVEYHTDGSTAGQFFPGANATAETHPTFLSSTACSVPQPTRASAIGFPDFHLTMVVNVDGAPPPPGCQSPSDIPWLSATPTSGSVAGGASSNVAVTVNAGTLSAGSYSANLCVTTSDPTQPLITVPISMTVGPPDGIHCSGFEEGEDGSCGSVVPPPPFTQPLLDPGFELTAGDGGSNPHWTGTDANDPGGTPFYGNNPHTGSMGAWLGGWRRASNMTFSQSVTIASGGPRFINYWRQVTLAAVGSTTMKVYVDGNVVETTDIVANGLDAAWVNKSIDISSYGDNTSHTIKFEYVATGPDDGNTFIDDVTINEQAGSARSSR